MPLGVFQGAFQLCADVEGLGFFDQHLKFFASLADAEVHTQAVFSVIFEQ